MTNTRDIKRIWTITDVHFGIRSNSLEWLEIHKDYFYNFLIPLIKENKKDGDALFMLGDVFESRQTLNILVLNEALKIVKAISQIVPVYMIIGNHDCYKKASTDVNSPIIFNQINNTTVYSSVELIHTAFNKKILLMPWQESVEQELDVVQRYDADYLFCHTHFGGISFNRRVVMDEGLDISEVAKFKKVYSGHIHYSQVLQNVRMIGSAFQLTRSDAGNKKQVVLLDLETDTEQIHINDHSPKFIKFKIDDILNMTHNDFQRYITNNFVDIIVEGNWISKFPFSTLVDSVHGYKKLNYVLSTIQKDYEFEEGVDEDINLEDLTKLYINSLTYSEGIKKNLLEASDRLYKKAIKYLQEKTTES